MSEEGFGSHLSAQGTASRECSSEGQTRRTINIPAHEGSQVVLTQGARPLAASAGTGAEFARICPIQQTGISVSGGTVLGGDGKELHSATSH